MDIQFTYWYKITLKKGDDQMKVLKSVKQTRRDEAYVDVSNYCEYTYPDWDVEKIEEVR